MESEKDRAVIIVRMEVGLDNGQSKIDDVEPVLMNDGVDKIYNLFHREVCNMGAKCFLKLSFAAVENSSANPDYSPSVWFHLRAHPYFSWHNKRF